MKLVIPSFPDGGPIPGEFAFCVPADEGHATFGPNRSPQPPVVRRSDCRRVSGRCRGRPGRAVRPRRREPGGANRPPRPAEGRLLSLGAGGHPRGHWTSWQRASTPTALRRAARRRAAPATACAESTATRTGSPATSRWRATTADTTARARRGTTSCSTTTGSPSTPSTCQASACRAPSAAPTPSPPWKGHVLAQSTWTGTYTLNPSLR